MKATIFWDLDDTLGRFDSLADWWPELQEGKSLKHADPLLVREAMGQALDALAQEGFSNVLTTYAIGDYAREALERVDLRPYFENRIFDRADLARNHKLSECKKYGTAIKKLGIEEQVENGRVVVVGNSPYDRPQGYPIPFIHQDDELELSGIVLASAIIDVAKGNLASEGAESRTSEGVRYRTSAEGLVFSYLSAPPGALVRPKQVLLSSDAKTGPISGLLSYLRNI